MSLPTFWFLLCIPVLQNLRASMSLLLGTSLSLRCSDTGGGHASMPSLLHFGGGSLFSVSTSLLRMQWMNPKNQRLHGRCPIFISFCKVSTRGADVGYETTSPPRIEFCWRPRSGHRVRSRTERLVRT